MQMSMVIFPLESAMSKVGKKTLFEESKHPAYSHASHTGEEVGAGVGGGGGRSLVGFAGTGGGPVGIIKDVVLLDIS